jgi:two-component SAPR family response regulator
MTRYKVLVVEDEPLIAFDIASMLDSLGCDMVGPVARLSDALKAVETETFDCAILDINVRGGFTTPIAEILLDRHVPLLLATGYSEYALPRTLVGQARLAKPYTSEQLERELLLLCSHVGEPHPVHASDIAPH